MSTPVNHGRVILHSDANSFYASVELIRHPELRDKPVAVCGDPAMRHGIILTKNPIAKRFGVKTGEALWQARQKCPELVLLPTHYDLYQEYSKRLRTLYCEYAGQVESYGLDECWIDLSGGTTIEDGARAADEIRARVRRELGITVSIGVSNNKVFSKLGSDLRKPDATTVIPEVGFEPVVWGLPATDLLFVGAGTAKKLNAVNILTIGDLANADPAWIARALGKNGAMLQAFARGEDRQRVLESDEDIAAKSIGNSTTPPRDLTDEDDVKSVTYLLAETVAGRLRRAGVRAGTVSIGVRRSDDLHWFGAQKRMNPAVNLVGDIAATALSLFREQLYRHMPLRSLGVHCTGFVPESAPCQLDMFGEAARRDKFERLEKTIDRLTDRFGDGVVHRGIVLADKLFSQIQPLEEQLGPASKKAAM